jgi:hypothetical protein
VIPRADLGAVHECTKSLTRMCDDGACTVIIFVREPVCYTVPSQMHSSRTAEAHAEYVLRVLDCGGANNCRATDFEGRLLLL